MYPLDEILLLCLLCLLAVLAGAETIVDIPVRGEEARASAPLPAVRGRHPAASFPSLLRRGGSQACFAFS